MKNRYNVLILEDDKDLLEILSEYVEDANLTYMVSSNVEQARQLLKNKKFDSMISDWSLQSKTFADILSDKEIHDSLPKYIIVCTGHFDIQPGTVPNKQIFLIQKPSDLNTIGFKLLELIKSDKSKEI